MRLFEDVQMRAVLLLPVVAPAILVGAVLGVMSLLVTSPLMVYAAIRGKHLKDPWRGSRKPKP